MPDDDSNPWDSFLAQRAPGAWWRPEEQAYLKKSDAILNRPFISNVWDPRPDLQSRIEDQRGLTLPELDLQAKYLQSRGAYGPNPLPPPEMGAYHSSELDPKYNVDTPLGMELGRGNVEPAAKQIALAHAGEVLSMHAPDLPRIPNTGRPDLPVGPPKKVVKKKEVK